MDNGSILTLKHTLQLKEGQWQYTNFEAYSSTQRGTMAVYQLWSILFKSKRDNGSILTLKHTLQIKEGQWQYTNFRPYSSN